MEYTPPLTQSGTTFELDPAHELSDLPPLWAVPDLIPCHRLSLIVAPSGTGLTTLACHLATSQAPGTRNQAPESPSDPDASGCEIVNDHYSFPSVLLITDRDAPDVLKPRLTALGADLSRILILSKTYHHHRSPDGYKPPIDTAEPFSCMDHNELSELLHENRGIRLVLIDNAELLFSDYNRPARARIQRQLSLLQAVANKREVAIVLLTSIPRLSSDPFRGALLSTFRDTARLVYLLAPDLNDPAAHLLFNLKNTLTTPIPNLQLHLLGQPAPKPPLPGDSSLPNDPAGYYGIISNHHPLTYPHYLHQRRHLSTRGPDPDRHDYACEFLRLTLAAGPMPVGARRKPAPGTLRYLADQAGCAWSTVERAKKTLQITSSNTGDRWTWQLPSTIPTRPAAYSELLPSVPSCLGAFVPSNKTCAPPPPTEAQLLISPAPTTQKDISITPANVSSNADASEPSRLDAFAAAPPSPGVAA